MIAHRRSTTGLFIRLAILCCLLALSFGFRGSGSVARDASSSSDVVLLRTEGFTSDNLIRLDPNTLADGPSVFATGADSTILAASVLTSRDGQTIAVMNQQRDVLVQRGLGGTVLFRIPEISSDWSSLALSADGSKLLMWFWSGSDAVAWRVYDTATGKKIAEFQFHSGISSVFTRPVVDPVGWKVYELVQGNRDYPSVRPWSNRWQQIKTGNYKLELNPSGQSLSTIIAFDLMTGQELGRVTLPDLVTGTWEEDLDPDPNSFLPMFREMIPGFAISPDGNKIAIVDASNNEITLIDTKTMKIERTLTMHANANLLDRLFALLPLAPRTASAKTPVGVALTANYSADGRHLYVGGWEEKLENNEWSQRGLGVSRVDLKDGVIKSHVLDGVEVYQFAEASNGDLYVAGYDFRSDDSTYDMNGMIARLDANADKVVAERTFSDYVEFVIVPSPER
jgi:WD40 repeat protein